MLEDDLSLINGLTFAFQKAGFELDIARTIKEADTAWTEGKYDLLILDVSLPDGSGFEICRKVRQTSKVPIIFLTVSDEEINVIMGLDIGGDDYITKPFGTGELRARVTAHLRRDLRERKNSFSISGVIFNLNAKEAEVQTGKIPFTKSEYEICEYLALHHGQTFTREQIYEAVFGFNGESDSSVISTHIKNIRNKLSEFNITSIQTIWGVGYKWV